MVARSRGAVARQQRLHGRPRRTPRCLGIGVVNELRFQFARRDQDVNSLDPRCGGPCDAEDQGGPTLEVSGFASVGRQRFTPQPRRTTATRCSTRSAIPPATTSSRPASTSTTSTTRMQSLPLHFGGRYIFAARCRRIPGCCRCRSRAFRRSRSACRRPTCRATATRVSPYGYSDLSLFAQDDWRVDVAASTLKLGLRYQNQFWPDVDVQRRRLSARTTFPSDSNNSRRGWRSRGIRTGDKKTSIHGAYGIFFDNHITGLVGITDVINGERPGADACRRSCPTRSRRARGTRPDRRLPERAPAAYPEPGDLDRSRARRRRTRTTCRSASTASCPGRSSLSANFVYARGFNQLGTIDYNPIVPSLGAGRRPEDVDGVPGRRRRSCSTRRSARRGIAA